MSQHRGGPLARLTKSDPPARPSLERPSLFAGMEDEDVDAAGDDTQRVRILSTLASTRRPSKGPTKIDGITRKRRGAWQTRALAAAMMLGVLALLAGFVMVLINGRTGSGQDAQTQQPAFNEGEHIAASTGSGKRTQLTSRNAPQDPVQGARTDNPLAALITPAPPVGRTPPAPQAAVIENVPVAPLAAPTSKPVVTAVASPSPAKPVGAITGQHTAPAAGLTRAEVSRPGKAAPQNRASNTARRDEDVALLEAMFAHTGARQAPLSAADELTKRCGGLSGAVAATCRARICVQHPTAAVCHTDP